MYRICHVYSVQQTSLAFRNTATLFASILFPQVPGFLVEFITPIIKVSKGKQVLPFYTLPEYDNWKESQGGVTKGWTIKYYKGLGTSTAAEAKGYFADLGFHRKVFDKPSA